MRRDRQAAETWKHVKAVAPGASRLIEAKSMDRGSQGYWSKRREFLRQQTLQIKRMHLESSGQLTLPIFGDGTARKLAESEAATLTVSKGLHLADQPQRKERA